MRLERHIGGLSLARKQRYLAGAGWRAVDGGWLSPSPDTEPLALGKAVHHQLTRDLSAALAASGWKVVGFSQRGYARMQDPSNQTLCSLPAALRRQARREGRPVQQLTYSLFLAALLESSRS